MSAAAAVVETPPPYGGPWKVDLLRVIDADTYEFRVRLPLFTDRRIEVRLKDVSAPEKRTTAGQEAMKYAAGVLEASDDIRIRTEIIKEDHEDMSFTRVIADVYVNGLDLGELLIAAGVARPGAFEG